MNNLTINLDNAVEYVKCLADNNRCLTCDQLNGPILRYPCGHCVCETCILKAEDCLRCLSPSISTNFTDVPNSRRVNHVSELLTAFQDLFNLDVYKRKRLSKQLKLEKQVFPECIQAPLKYCNKRKSLNIVQKNKENYSVPFLPGEQTLKPSKMDKTFNYVQQWLNKNESSIKNFETNLPRRPFADLNVNDQNSTRDKSLSLYNRQNTVINKRKRTHIKVLDSSKERNLKPKKKKKEISVDKQLTFLQDEENNESGIVIDDSVLIEDSQIECVDKDKLALMDIKEAEKEYPCNIRDNDEENINYMKSKFSATIINENITTNFQKIPFYKRSLLYKICSDCPNEKFKFKESSEDVVVMIDSKSFTTTIKFSQCPTKNVNTLQSKSVEVQTVSEPNPNNQLGKDTIIKNKNDIDLITNKTNQDDLIKDHILEYMKPSNRVKHVVIEDSDSDSEVTNLKDNNVVVTAEVHRSFDDLGVLNILDPQELENRMRHSAREHTPVSTDSSDKENYDPNRLKRQKITKKCYTKK